MWHGNRIRLLGALWIPVLALALAACAQTSAREPILIGVSGPLSGNYAQYGTQWKKGFDLALDEINAAGGVRGHPLAYTFEDSQSDPKQSVLVAQKFVADDDILMALGDCTSPAAMAAAPIYQRAGLVQLGFTVSHPDFTKTGPYIWSSSISQSDAGPLLADYVADLGLKHVAVLHINSDWGKTTFDLVSRRLAERGVKVVAVDSYLPDEKDFRTPLTSAKSASPDGIVLISYYGDGALIVQQLRDLGSALPVVASGSVYSPKFLELAGPAAEGVYLSSSFSPDDPRPEVQSYLKKFRARYNEESDYWAALAYDAMKLSAMAIEQGGTSRAAVREALATLKGVPSVIHGSIAFDPETRRVAAAREVRLVVKGHKFAIWGGGTPMAAH